MYLLMVQGGRKYAVDVLLRQSGNNNRGAAFDSYVIKIIEMILRHSGLWDIRNHDPSPSDPVHIPELVYA